MNPEVVSRKRPPRSFENARAVAVMNAIREIFKQNIRKAYTVHEMAVLIDRTPRWTRDWLACLHRKGELYISHYEESTALRGKKLPAYKMKRTGRELDAIKYWLHETDSEGGTCD